MDSINTISELITLLIGLGGLITSAISVFIAIKSLFKAHKEKSFKEKWSMLMKFADEAMDTVEDLYKSGKLDKLSKKDKAVEIINKLAEEAGIDVTPFTSQLSAYIDNTIAFVNKMNKKK